MKGSLGIWFNPPSDKPSITIRPNAEIHVNLWRDVPGLGSFIDIGIFLSSTDDLGRFYLYFPTRINKSAIFDLGAVLKFEGTLNAVFNDTIDIISHHSSYFVAEKSSKNKICIHIVDIENSIALETIPLPHGLVGTVIVFSEDLSNEIRQSQIKDSKSYVRIRFLLDKSSESIFYDKIRPEDGWLSTSFGRLEINEFRINEQRSFPKAIVDWSSGQDFHIKRILYFLIRDSSYELMIEHAHFHRTRRLEEDIWLDYLNSHIKQEERERRLRESNTIDMLIYQWKEIENLDPAGKLVPVSDFSAFSMFRAPVNNSIFYLIAAFLVGAIGSSISSAAAILVQKHTGVNIFDGDEHVISVVILLSLAALTYQTWRRSNS